MNSKILKNVLEEQYNVLKINKIIKNFEQMHLIVLYKKKMQPKVGIHNFIDYKIRYIQIG